MATAFELVEDTPLMVLERIVTTDGDLSAFMDEVDLTNLGSEVVADYERDCTSREDWAKIVREALKSAAQESTPEDKNTPFTKASNVKYPLLTIAATEFNARAYPAIVKGDETIQVKVVGSDKGRPVMEDTMFGPVPKSQMQLNPETNEEEPVMGQDGNPVPVWEVPPGFKAARAGRVKDYLNVVLNYRMVNWEGDTDAMLYQLSIVGCGFRKQWWDNRKGEPCSAYVPALRLVAPMDAPDIETVPRLTEEIPDQYPYIIERKMKAGIYRTIDLVATTDDDQAPRTLLEQHRYIDMDGDGFDEPYIVTVDKETSEVLSIIAAFTADGIKVGPEGITDIEKTVFFTKYDFLPHPEGKFYGIGLGHLLAQLGGVIDTTINLMIDAGHAQVAGGGFISSGLRLQGSGQTNTLRWRPGEFKVVSASAGALRDAIWERTVPQPSLILFELLGLILGAAKDVAAIKDVTSGDASNNGQVGTTLALIEQGLQVFTAIYKRVYRGLKSEFKVLFDNIARYGGEKAAEDYANVLDDSTADFAGDFNVADMDIRPVSDPNSVTRLQKMAKAQFLLQTGKGDPMVDQRELMMRVYEAADVEDIEKLLPPPVQSGPDPMMVAQVNKLGSEIEKNEADAEYSRAKTEEVRALLPEKLDKSKADVAKIGADIGTMLADGEPDGDDTGRLPEMA